MLNWKNAGILHQFSSSSVICQIMVLLIFKKNIYMLNIKNEDRILRNLEMGYFRIVWNQNKNVYNASYYLTSLLNTIIQYLRTLHSCWIDQINIKCFLVCLMELR